MKTVTKIQNNVSIMWNLQECSFGFKGYKEIMNINSIGIESKTFIIWLLRAEKSEGTEQIIGQFILSFD